MAFIRLPSLARRVVAATRPSIMPALTRFYFILAVLAVSVLTPVAAQTALTAHQAEPIAWQVAVAAVPEPEALVLSGAQAGRCPSTGTYGCLDEPLDPLTGMSRAWRISYYTEPFTGHFRREIHIIVRDGVGSVGGTSRTDIYTAALVAGWLDSDSIMARARVTAPSTHPEWTGQAFLDAYPEAQVSVAMRGGNPTWTPPGGVWSVGFRNPIVGCEVVMGLRFDAYSGGFFGALGNFNGSPGWCPPPVATDEDPVPSFALGPPRPNPAGPQVAIPFELGRPGPIRLDVFDAAGRLLATLAEGHYPSGRHVAIWSVENAAPGTYVLRLRSLDGDRATLITRPP
jgi:hypothetical protein